MDSLSTPGVYFESLQPNPIRSDLLRSDIAGFIGYTERGPIASPVRIASWRQFLAIFGNPVANGHLAPAVKGFFENGGATCYIARIVDENGQAAKRWLATSAFPEVWQLCASFRIADLIVSEGVENALNNGAVDSATLRNIAIDDTKKPLPNIGAWGNAIRVSLQYKPRLSTQTTHVFNNGFSANVQNMVGLEAYSVVQISQEYTDPEGLLKRLIAEVTIDSIDTARQTIHWNQSILVPTRCEPPCEPGDLPTEFDRDKPLRVDTVEIDIDVRLGDRNVEQFRWLGIHPLHSRSIHDTLAKESQYINLEYLGGSSGAPGTTSPEKTDWTDNRYWPSEVSLLELRNGQDGVSQISDQHYLSALNQLAEVDEISITAAPDLVLSVPNTVEPILNVVNAKVDCKLLQAPAQGGIAGIVDDGNNPLAGVQVIDLVSGRLTKTNHNGAFTLTNIPFGLRTLTFDKPGFVPEERQLLSTTIPTSTDASGTDNTISLQPLTEPRQLTETEILTVQQAMTNPTILGTYRVALLDPPQPNYSVDDIRAWRAQLGDSSFAALYYPWLQVTPPLASSGELLTVPPSGHVAGLLAKNDQLIGPHRAAANTNLRYSKHVASHINDIHHGILNLENVNIIRALPGQGIRILGARTLSSDSEWRYFNVRRLVLAIEKTLEQTLQWAVFEANEVILRQAITLSINTLLNVQWRKGALAGKTQDAAYRIKCDIDNNPASERDQGRLIAEIGLAPSVPFEFIRVRFDRTLDRLEVTE